MNQKYFLRKSFVRDNLGKQKGIPIYTFVISCISIICVKLRALYCLLEDFCIRASDTIVADVA